MQTTKANLCDIRLAFLQIITTFVDANLLLNLSLF